MLMIYFMIRGSGFGLGAPTALLDIRGVSVRMLAAGERRSRSNGRAGAGSSYTLLRGAILGVSPRSAPDGVSVAATRSI